MISFFRKIRQKPFSQNRITRYLLYALGEIFLVVIGILIALQVNNWNEQRRAEQYETILLKQMQNALNNDLFLIKNFFEPRVQQNKEGVDSLLQYVQMNEMPDQETIRRLVGKMLTDFLYRFDSGPYENLKSNGLDIIKNDSLRNYISNLYGQVLPSYALFINEFKDEREEEIKIYLRKFIKDELTVDEVGKPYLREVPNINDIRDENLLRVINLRSFVYKNNRARLDAVIESNRKGEAMIAKELKSRIKN
ncbi:DUF6090 family protein [Algoriphagus halophilus]|uniref:Uncharacterized protein n=1 Tax=Algoriphagus halophilus TaxID=226505 RepID=A0A1N6G272_9BACT|nr:DUF6090 family protein [Algoriphagus halophilus]SIO01676.1 hypothetical protein SAMN05444394_2915 [Algoriphagus halophilus]